MSLLWPFALLLLPLPLLLRLWPARRGAADAPDVPPALARALLSADTAGRARRPGWRRVALGLAWIALVLAIAQPVWRSGAEVRPASGRAMMLAIDLSASMERRDFTLDGRRTDRLTAVKAVAGDFIRTRQGDRVGLVLFGDEAFVAAPPSFDLASVAAALDESAIGMAGRTTAIGDALGLAVVRLRDDPAPERAIVLLSDGTSNAGSAEPEDAARLAGRFGIRIHTLALGARAPLPESPQVDPSADLDTATLDAVARESGGRFFRVGTLDELEAVYAAIGAMEAGDTTTPPIGLTRDLRVVPTLVLLALLLALGWPGGTFRRRQA